MLKRVILTIFIILFSCSLSQADEWNDLVREALKQRPSKSKRRTSSGKRLLREKMRRLNEIDHEVPFLIKEGDFVESENLLKEALRLTIEYYKLEDPHVAERFISLGILYMSAGHPDKAEEAFTWALNIGETVFGQKNFQVSNIYRFLAAAYYEQGKYSKAEQTASTLLSIYVQTFGPKSSQAAEAKELLKKIYKR